MSWTKGRSQTPEHRANIAAAKRGVPRSIEARAAISAGQLGKPRPDKAGERHHNWQGDSVGYWALHDWVNDHKGFARDGVCAHADNTCRGLLQNANISGEYRRDVGDFMVLCVSHHVRYDRGRY